MSGAVTWRRIALGLALLALVYGAMSWPRWRLRASMAAGFGARIACGCRYIDRRDLASCRTDFKGLEGMGMVRLTDDPQARTVHAWVPLLARREARYVPPFGCLPDAP